MDTLYKLEDSDLESRPIFEQLRAEFGAVYQIWRRAEDFGRSLSAAVLDPSTQTAAEIILRRGVQARTSLSSVELQKIKKHLVSRAKNDFVLKLGPSRVTRRPARRTRAARR
jgi:hypothetical protein